VQLVSSDGTVFVAERIYNQRPPSPPPLRPPPSPHLPPVPSLPPPSPPPPPWTTHWNNPVLIVGLLVLVLFIIILLRYCCKWYEKTRQRELGQLHRWSTARHLNESTQARQRREYEDQREAERLKQERNNAILMAVAVRSATQRDSDRGNQATGQLIKTILGISDENDVEEEPSAAPVRRRRSVFTTVCNKFTRNSAISRATKASPARKTKANQVVVRPPRPAPDPIARLVLQAFCDEPAAAVQTPPGRKQDLATLHQAPAPPLPPPASAAADPDLEAAQADRFSLSSQSDWFRFGDAPLAPPHKRPQKVAHLQTPVAAEDDDTKDAVFTNRMENRELRQQKSDRSMNRGGGGTNRGGRVARWAGGEAQPSSRPSFRDRMANLGKRVEANSNGQRSHRQSDMVRVRERAKGAPEVDALEEQAAQAKAEADAAKAQVRALQAQLEAAQTQAAVEANRQLELPPGAVSRLSAAATPPGQFDSASPRLDLARVTAHVDAMDDPAIHA